jgi:protein N-terminal methyltransferase
MLNLNIDFYSRKGLKANGVIVVKENMTSSGEVELDEADSSVTRPESHLREIFEKSDLVVFREMQQLKFPKEIYQVKMFGLRPK